MSRQKLNLSTIINAPKEKVWKVLLNDETYRQWAALFMEGSHAITDWNEGSKALFLGPDKTGMVSRIKKHIPAEMITIEHLGIVKDNQEDYDSDEAKEWQGTLETYRVEEENGKTRLEIDQDVTDEYKEYFDKAWMRALEKIKELAEK